VAKSQRRNGGSGTRHGAQHAQSASGSVSENNGACGGISGWRGSKISAENERRNVINGEISV
jgi:hypothetical protein